MSSPFAVHLIKFKRSVPPVSVWLQSGLNGASKGEELQMVENFSVASLIY
jgi:hypothetical protein